MTEDKKNNIATSDETSELQEKKTLTNDELLESILNKKKTKKATSKKAVSSKPEEKSLEKKEKKSTETQSTPKKKSTKSTKKGASEKSLDTATKKTNSTKEKSSAKKNSNSKKTATTKKEKVKNIDADELLENIITKKSVKKAKSATASKPKLKKESPNEKEKTTFPEFLEPTNTEKKQSNLLEKESLTQEVPTTDEKNNPEEKTISPVQNQPKKEDLIITRKITFDDEKINLKNKKTLEELRKAIEEFDRLETLSEIANSSDKINDLTSGDLPTESKESERDLFKTSMLVFEKRSNRKNMSKNKKSSLGLDKDTKEFDYLRDFEDFVSPEEIRPKNRRKLSYVDKEDLKAIILLGSCVILLFLLLLILIFYFEDNGISQSADFDQNTVNIEVPPPNEEEIKKLQYQECLKEKVTELDYTDDLNEQIANLTKYISKNYKASIYYENLDSGFSYSHNPEAVYYAASTIKALDALYVYTKVANNELDLEEKIEYTSKFKYKSSKGMESYKFGEKVSIRNLVKYAVVYSDNSAHQMLIDYIGKSTLKEFANGLGAKKTLLEVDDFGNIDVYDAIVYMKEINKFINTNKEYGEELKSLFLEAEQNDLAIPDLEVEAAHKYGSYGAYYHDIGIVYADSPYVVAILTTEGKGDYEAKVKDINRHLYDLNKSFTDMRATTCQNKIYNK